VAGRGGIAAAPGLAEQGRGRRKEGGGERLTGGAGVSMVGGKRKGGAGRWAAAGKR
jgi:hypothetical protein